MKIRFLIEYITRWGEEVCIHLEQLSESGKKTTKVVPMITDDGQHWILEVKLPKTVQSVSYYYLIKEEDEVTREEWRVTSRTIHLCSSHQFTCYDRWKDIPQDAYLYTSAFTDGFARRSRQPFAPVYGDKTLLITVTASQLRAGECLAVLGNQPELGLWDVTKAVRLVETQYNEWTLALNTDKLKAPVEYKYLVIDEKTGELKTWESHDNRRLHIPSLLNNEVELITDEPVFVPYENWKGAGCVIPVFSLRSQHSFGIGDFGDIKRMVDWVALTGQRVLQILPINDTTITNTWTDSYPYNSISIYAFHPQYVDLNALPSLNDKEKADEFESKRVELNALPRVDYEAVNNAKRSYLKLLFEQEGKKMMESEEFKKFFADNEHWLQPYAAFSYLRDKNGTPDFRTWSSHKVYKAAAIKTLCSETSQAYSQISFYYFIQYILHIQLVDASSYARSKGVVIKGDIPIGISPNSVEAWVEPYYFNMNGQAGAPPDPFSANGQNWGFPTYNWDAMLDDGCQWWLRRFRKMAEYFDAYRIDHVLGFFRIWEIPSHSVHGLLGQFSPAMPMSVAEIEKYGLPFRKEMYTRPYITDQMIDDIFSKNAENVRHNYLEKTGNGLYAMKPEYDTQRKVESHFKQFTDPEALSVRDGLYTLISEVLFVVDRKDPNGYHPRISANLDYVYHMLNDAEKGAFMRLYNDYFYRRHNQFWFGEAMKKLPILTSATRMLVCAEDLGMVPDCVPGVMDALRILTLEIQSMPKNPNYQFGHLEENPYRSVATIATHDMPTMRGWWAENPELTQQFYNSMLQKSGSAPQPMPGWICEEVVTRHLFSPSMLCLISLQDWLSMDEQLRYQDPDYERINVPAIPRYYWRYRMHLCIEDLMVNTPFNDKIRTLIERSGR